MEHDELCVPGANETRRVRKKMASGESEQLLDLPATFRTGNGGQRVEKCDGKKSDSETSRLLVQVGTRQTC